MNHFGYPEYNVVGFKNSLEGKTKLIDISEVKLNKTILERYRSLYRFHREDARVLTSLSNIPQSVRFYADYLVIDIDDPDGNLDNSLLNAKRLSYTLFDKQVLHDVWFSGRKGFHINIPSCQFMFEPTTDDSILKKMADSLGGRELGIDLSIYNKSRVLRTPNSRHKTSSLYKIFISSIIQENLPDILSKAKECQSDGEPLNLSDIQPNEFMINLYEQAKVRINRIVVSNDVPTTSIFPPAVKGERNNTMFKVAKKLSRRGIPLEDATWIVKAWNDRLEDPEKSQHQIDSTIKSAYKNGVNQVVEEENFSQQFFTANKSLTDLYDDYANISQNIIKTGFSDLDAFSGGFLRSDLIFWIARPGNFKTAFLSSVLQRTAQNMNQTSIMFSMDTSRNRLTRRHVQYAEGLSSAEVSVSASLCKPFPVYVEKFKNVVCCYLSGLSINQIVGLLDFYMEEYNGKICAVGYDYLSLFKGCASNTEVTSKTVTELKSRVSKASNALNICLSQASRTFGDGDVEIDRQAGKDSSSIEDAADYIFGSWWHQNKSLPERWVKCLKAREYNESSFSENQHFKLKLSPKFMRVDDVVRVDYNLVPDFKQPSREY